MEWLKEIFDPATLSLLIPVIAIVGIFAMAGLRAHHKHLERLEKIKQGFFNTTKR